MLLALVFLSSTVLIQPSSSGVVDRLEASVNSNLILRSDLNQFRKTVNLRRQLDPLFAGSPIALKGAAARDEEVVQFLINERMVSIQFPVADSEVEQEINSIQSNNRIDLGTLKRALSNQGYRFEDYFELIRASTAKRNLIDRDIRSKVVITDDDVRSHMAGGGRSNTPSKRAAYRISLISFDSKDVADSAIEAIRSGESFEAVREKVHGDDPNSILGPLTESQMSPLIRSQIKKLGAQQTSAVFSGGRAGGFYILKLIDVTETAAGGGGPVDEAVRGQLAASEYSRQIQLWLDRQRLTLFVRVAGQK